jgi:hypothetical protein
MHHPTVRSLLAGAVLVAALAAPASAQSRIRVGILECRGAGTASFVVGSVNHFACEFRPSVGARRYRYEATVRRFGVDLGVTGHSVLTWAVFAPTRRVAPGELSGNYVGASAGAAVGVGAGANVLIGGSRDSVALQPLSVQGQTGINVAVGVAGLELRYGRR